MPPKLVVSQLNTDYTFTVELTRAEIRIGRDRAQNDIALLEHVVSRHHALLKRIGDSYVLIDRSTQPSQVLISGATMDALKGRFPVKRVGDVKVKGRITSAEVHELLWRLMA